MIKLELNSVGIGIANFKDRNATMVSKNFGNTGLTGMHPVNSSALISKTIDTCFNVR
ncbi:MAG: hypothetical protein ACJAYB_001155 [Psychromonas sp.]|jgi:hypothetical protein